MSMMKRSKAAAWLLAGAFMLGSAFPAWAAEAPVSSNVKTDAQIVADLGVLQGDGSGVSASYLAKTTTRLQSAILFLRLQGLEATAAAFKGADNFSDAAQVNDSNKAILGYLKANPQLGWTGTGNGKFEPMAQITAQQYYKVLLESLGYKQDTDFKYDGVIAYAGTLGLSQVANAGSLRNLHIATATVEALKSKVKGGSKTLLDTLVEKKVVDTAKAAGAQTASIKIAANAAVGSYLTDEAGRTLYMFMKDTPNVSTCKDQCVTNWPLFAADSIQISGDLNAADFKTIVREDGKKQTTYKGWPLYYYAKDEKAGETKGQGVGGSWMVMNYSGIITAKNDTLGTFLTDSKGMALYLYTRDTANISVCKGNCEVNWPIFYTEHFPNMGDLKAADFGTITREDGTKQTTYQGWPLYYYIKDVKAGDVTGQDVGKVWYVLDPAATPKVPASAAPAPAPAPAQPTPAPAQPATTPAPASQAAAKNYSINMDNFKFSETVLTVEVGSTITFTNNHAFEHNAVSDKLKADGTPVFETKLLAKGQSESITLTEPGEYTYYCDPHKDFMKATIIVK
ncbi:Predicted lipoprotein with conserved Yx(FWY)xxD motif [Paenibacillus sp. 1_12]|uniref:plastocyanin/azurin family copper-binding protein n=1 Tax=Paenibacillus sp. 1_12 TaxID=1566278 RepID=UPI0008EB4958|nr:plastocyanin/azurin family copper-binding protein [Paenibacillus sp. 1_12]SFL49671.1 Predicted lipoprotein with conserved Yx(FWY)xxD motif [Paenibacillus sp. 1_12]